MEGQVEGDGLQLQELEEQLVHGGLGLAQHALRDREGWCRGVKGVGLVWI